MSGQDSEDDRSIIKPTSDVFTAALWSAPKNEPILRSFINAVLSNSGAAIVAETTVLNPFNIKEFAVDKNLILDVRARDELRRLYNIEVQTASHTGFRNRPLLYWADTYSSLLRIGDNYAKLVPVISMTLTDFPIFSMLERIHTVFEARSRENPEVVLTDHFQMHYLRLGNLIKRQMRGIDQLNRKLQNWMNFFAYGAVLSEDKMSQLVDNDIMVELAYQEFQRFNANSQMREIVRKRQRFLEDYQIGMDSARDEGRDEGRVEGRVEGIEIGEIRGEIKMALRLRFGDLPIDLVKDISTIDDMPKLLALAERASKCATLDDFVAMLRCI